MVYIKGIIPYGYNILLIIDHINTETKIPISVDTLTLFFGKSIDIFLVSNPKIVFLFKSVFNRYFFLFWTIAKIWFFTINLNRKILFQMCIERWDIWHRV